MLKKKNTYIDMELEWLEEYAKELKDYCDSHRPSALKDRIVGGKTMATIEKQLASVRETLQDYAKIVEIINRLREDERGRGLSIRGDQSLSPLETKQI